MDFSTVRAGELLAGISGGVLFIVMFLPWFGPEVGDQTVSAWEAFDFVVYRVIEPVDDATRKYGLFLGLIAVAGIALGGWVAMQEEGTSFGGEADRRSP